MNEQRVHELLQQSLQLYGSDLVSRVEWLLDQPGPEAAEARFRLRHGWQSRSAGSTWPVDGVATEERATARSANGRELERHEREFYAGQKFDRDQQRGAPDGL